MEEFKARKLRRAHFFLTEFLTVYSSCKRSLQLNSSIDLYFFLFFRNIDPPIWYDTDVKLFEIQRV